MERGPAGADLGPRAHGHGGCRSIADHRTRRAFARQILARRRALRGGIADPARGDGDLALRTRPLAHPRPRAPCCSTAFSSAQSRR